MYGRVDRRVYEEFKVPSEKGKSQKSKVKSQTINNTSLEVFILTSLSYKYLPTYPTIVRYFLRNSSATEKWIALFQRTM